MRIGFDGRYLSPHYPGIGRYAGNLLRALAPLIPADELYVFVRSGRARTELGRLAEAANVRVVPVPWGPLDARQHGGLRRLARRLRLDLFHAPSYTVPLYMPCPTLVTLHDLIPLLYPADVPKMGARLAYRWLVRLAVTRAAHVIVDSEATRRDLLAFGAAGRQVTVIPLAPAPAFSPRDRESVALTLAGLGMERPYVLTVGINKPHKNLLGLLKAWAALPAAVRDEHVLVWAGPQDPRYPAETECIRGLGSAARSLGPVSDAELSALYAGATCAVVPSFAEGFGLPAVEAMACGTPLLCSNRAALPEVAGEAALYFDPDEPGSLGRELATMLADEELRRGLAARGLERAARFSWERTAEATLRVYREVVGAH